MFVTRGESLVNLHHISLVLIRETCIELYGTRTDLTADETEPSSLPLIESYYFKNEDEAKAAFEKIKQITQTIHI